MKQWFSNNHTTIYGWTAVIVGALILLWISWGTQYHQLAVGLLASSIVLAATLLLFEIIFHFISVVISSAGGHPKR